MQPVPLYTPSRITYPEADGQPMAETDFHRDQMTDLLYTLRAWFGDRAYVAGNLFVYYVEGDPKRCFAPDVMVVRGVPPHRRRVYKVWEEGRSPELVIEVTSRSTEPEDLGAKKGLYAYLGVREYFLFDPLEEYLTPSLQGFRLAHGQLERMIGDPLHSEVLGLDLVADGGALRLREPGASACLPVPEEWRARAEEERRAREAAERELARVRAELDRLKGGQE